MSARETTGQSYSFGAFALKPDRRELLREGAPVDLGTRAFDLLAYLVLRPGRIVSKQSLLDAVWNGRSIQQNNLTVQISMLRRILGEDAAGQPYIRTFPGQGYMFVAEPVRRTAPCAGANKSETILQPADPFVGRESEQRELQTLMAQRRLITVAGLGGVGKTRLVRHLAPALATGFADGWRLLDLVDVADAQGLVEALAETLGIAANAGEAALLGMMGARHMLLILDNAEQLEHPLARLLRLILPACPQVSILLTSRESLGVPGEQVFRLPPLAVPPAGPLNTEQVLGYDAVRLFVARAGAAIPGFVLDGANAQDVGEICRRLDGIALAVEMMVPRLQVLSPRQIADRLSEPFKLLPTRGATTRQRSLRSVFDWSWERLRDGERRLLQHLAASSGSASLHTLTALAAADGVDDWQVIDDLGGLVAKSLVRVDTGCVEARYSMLETMRLYTLERTQAHPAPVLRYPQAGGAIKQAAQHVRSGA